MSDEPKRVITGCKHTVERMLEWCKEGACPICTTAEAGMLREQLAQAKAELGAWHSAFGTTQLSHALEAYEQTKTIRNELFRLRQHISSEKVKP